VDDALHRNSKVRKVAVKSPAALALWLIAGSWSAEELTEGFIPDDDLQWLVPGAVELAAELVAARLWKRVKGGHQFHEWLENGNPSREKVVAEREAAKERMRKLRAGKTGGSRERSGEQMANGRRNFDDSKTSFRSSGRASAPPARGLIKPHPWNPNGTGCADCTLPEGNAVHRQRGAK
jgi:hypothetical protein